MRVTPADAGFFFTSRPRNYYVLTLRGRVKAGRVQRAYEEVSQHLRVLATDSWTHWAWRATPDDLAAEENAARQRLRLPDLPPGSPPSPDWCYLLTNKQRGYLAQYEATWLAQHGERASANARCLFNLGDSPGFGAASSRIPTSRRGCTRLWSPHRRQWLTHPERAAAMGFPVYPDLAEAARVPLDHAALQAPASSLGNAMHVANVGVVVAVVACACYSAGPAATP